MPPALPGNMSSLSGERRRSCLGEVGATHEREFRGRRNVQSAKWISTWVPTIFPLSVGPHTFNMQYESSSGTSNCSANYLKVQPL
jgi:hypothetical protein